MTASEKLKSLLMKYAGQEENFEKDFDNVFQEKNKSPEALMFKDILKGMEEYAKHHVTNAWEASRSHTQWTYEAQGNNPEPPTKEQYLNNNFPL